MDKHLDADALSDYAEGVGEYAESAADGRARADAEAHLASCERCRRELAAARAYFRELAGLEPARAPADFLAKVRARLPAPSPWRRAWAAFMAPWRAVPAPIAVAVVLGVTAITIYIRQGAPGDRNAALTGETPVPAPSAPIIGQEPSAPAGPPPELPGAPAPERMPSAGAAPERNASSEPAGRSALSGHLARKRRNSVPEAPAAPAVGSASARPGVVPGPKAALPAPNPAVPSAPASPRKDDRAAKEVEPEGWSDKPSEAYVRDNSNPAARDLPLDKEMAVEEEHEVPGQAEAAAGHASVQRGSKAGSGRQAEPKAQSRAEEAVALPAAGYAVSLRAAGDTAAILAGLRSMGAEALPISAAPGESRFRLRVPPGMVRELGPYLSRHGVLRQEGKLPAAGSGDPVSLRLRLLFPAR